MNPISSIQVGKGLEDYWSDLVAWWNSRSQTEQIVIGASAGLVIILLIWAIIPSGKPSKYEELERLMRLKLMKEIAE